MQIDEPLKNKIYELYDECISSTEPFHRKLDLFIVPETLAQRILDETGIDVAGHWVCLDNYGIVHTLEHHGNPIFESRRGQVAIDREDFITMLEVFLYPDEIHASGKTNNSQKPTIQFIKTIKDKIYVVKEVRTITSLKKNKLSRLVFQTMFKTKADKLA
jgi:phage-Barnase-EndoU-ColicinE5/D-RelE like nuclease3